MVRTVRASRKTRRRNKGTGTRDFALAVLRRYGRGVPTEERVLSSATNAVTLMIQGSLVPFRKANGRVQLGELKLHQLPWPREQLLDLGATPVELASPSPTSSNRIQSDEVSWASTPTRPTN